jgi:hypothetical protein
MVLKLGPIGPYISYTRNVLKCGSGKDEKINGTDYLRNKDMLFKSQGEGK